MAGFELRLRPQLAIRAGGVILVGLAILASCAVPAAAQTALNTTPPSISGPTQLGQTLTEVPGTWTGAAGPITVHWEDCVKGTRFVCTEIANSPTAPGSQYVPGNGDLGKWITVVETAPSTRANGQLALARPVGPVTVGGFKVTMRWTFYYTPFYTRVLGLAVHGLSRGMRVVVRCRGTGCPSVPQMSAMLAASRCDKTQIGSCSSGGSLDLTPAFLGRPLAVGARITVAVSGVGAVRKYYRFTVRARQAPSIAINYVPA